jgi:hypothetical protein
MSIESDLPSYFFDQEGLAGIPDPAEKLHLGDGGHVVPDLHNNLFDQDATEAGDTIDPVTGERYDFSTYTGAEDLQDVTTGISWYEELLDDAEAEAAAQGEIPPVELPLVSNLMSIITTERDNRQVNEDVLPPLPQDVDMAALWLTDPEAYARAVAEIEKSRTSEDG